MLLTYEGLPCSRWLAEVHPRWNIPVNAVLVSIGFTVLLSLVGSFARILVLRTLCVLILTDQYRLHRCYERSQFSGTGCDSLFVYHHNQLFDLAPAIWRTTATKPLESRQMGPTYQYHIAYLHASSPGICDVAAGATSNFPEYVSGRYSQYHLMRKVLTRL